MFSLSSLAQCAFPFAPRLWVRQRVSPFRLVLSPVVFAVVCCFGAVHLAAQVSTTEPRIAEPVQDSHPVVLRGGTHPLARAEYDRGLAPTSLPMNRVMLLLKRSPQQEAALEALLAEQQDKSSPNYHKWLTPAEFGAQFGPSDQDIHTVEAWLESDGFTIDQVSRGRTVIEFSGTAAQVQAAFHTEIHQYVLPDGAQHWANSANPEIPAELAPVVSGLRSLNTFYPRPLSRTVRLGGASRGVLPKYEADYTFPQPGGCSAVQYYENVANPLCFMVTPYDFATIYSVVPLWNAGVDGSGQTIAVANDSNVNPADISTFRSLMGLPAKAPQVILATGVDPGISVDETEAVVDTEWSGAVAKNATIDLVIAPSTNTTFGGDLAAEYIVDNNLAPVLSFSFGACEPSVGDFYQSLWQQAAAEGITVLVASGDGGSAGCPYLAGLQVSGTASTPYDVAVGGTDFDDVSDPGQYWSLEDSNSAAQPSALGYIPETTWNDSCTNTVYSTPPLNAQFGDTQEAACNNTTLNNLNNGLAIPVGGSGGVSTIYAKPCWQVATLTAPCTQAGTATPGDGARDLPDISLFAGNGYISASFYYLCESDSSSPPQTCSLSGEIDGVGGTSVSAQAMAGIVALVDQKAGARQGNINPTLYGLATQGTNTCRSASPTSGCIFYDVTTGTITMPCAYSSNPSMNSPDCFANNATDTVGILESNGQPAYNAGPGYDLATGLGSINATNLVNASVWAGPSGGPDFSITSQNPTVTLDSTGKGTMSITITPQNGFASSLNLSCPGLPEGDACSFSPSSPIMIDGSTTITVTVSGMTASVPAGRNPPADPAVWRNVFSITFTFVCSAALLLFGIRLRHCRWNTALVLLAFALFVIAGCGGGASSSSNSGGGGSAGGSTGGTGGGGTGGPTGSPFMTTITATTCTNGTGCNGGTTHSLVFTVE